MGYDDKTPEPGYEGKGQTRISLTEAQKAAHRFSVNAQKELEQGLREALPEPLDPDTAFLHRHDVGVTMGPDNTLMKYDTSSAKDTDMVPAFANCGGD